MTPALLGRTSGEISLHFRECAHRASGVSKIARRGRFVRLCMLRSSKIKCDNILVYFLWFAFIDLIS